MPTVARIRGHRFFFFSNEGHEAPHIHVQHERKLAKFWLSPVALAASSGFASHELRNLSRAVAENREDFLRAWHEFFGR